MKRLNTRNTKRLIADVLPPGEVPKPELNAFGHIIAEPIEPDPSDLTVDNHFSGLGLRAVGRNGVEIRAIRIPNDCLFQPARERGAAMYLSVRLVLYELTNYRLS